MEKNIQKNTKEKLFTVEELQQLRDSLPGMYYPEFRKLWKKTYPKEEVPIRQTIYLLLQGKTDNDKALALLIAIVEERRKLKQHMNNVVNGFKQEAATAD